jgi:hypothetical protein
MMEAPTGWTGAVREAAAPGLADEARQWVEAWAGHVRKRFNSRAVVSARVSGAEPVTVTQVYALEGGGLVLVMACDHAAEEEPHGGDAHGHDRERADHHEGGGHDHATHPHVEMEGCSGDCEVWLASPAQVVFEVRCAAEGALCTGFGVLGLSRTPQVLIPRAMEPPPRRGHDHGEF